MDGSSSGQSNFIKWLLIPFIVAIFIASFVAPSLNTASVQLAAEKVDNVLGWLYNEGYVAWAVSGLVAGEVPYATGSDTLAGDTSFTYDEATNTLSVDNIAAPTGRGATFVVAANDSSSGSKAQADYVCDGTTDEVEINAAIDALPANGGKVLLLEGSYELSDDIAIEKNYVWLSGCGTGTFLKLNTDNTSGIHLGTAGTAVQAVHITNLRISGLNGDLDNGRTGLYVVNAIRCYFDKLAIDSCGGWGIEVDYNHSLFFNHITLMSNGRTKNTTGNLKIGTSSQPVNIMSFVNSAVETGGTGIKINQGSMPIIQNVTIESNNYYGIHVNQTVGRNMSLENLLLENNNIRDSANAKDIYIEKANNTSLINGVFINSRVGTAHSLYVAVADNLRIEGGWVNRPVYISPLVQCFIEGDHGSTIEAAATYPYGNRSITQKNLYNQISPGISALWGADIFLPFLEGSNYYIGDISGNLKAFNLVSTYTWGTITKTGKPYVDMGYSAERAGVKLDGDRTFVLAVLPAQAYNYDRDNYFLDWYYDADNRISILTADVAGGSVTKFSVEGAGTEKHAEFAYPYAGGDPLVIVGTLIAATGEVKLYINGEFLNSDTGAGTVTSETAKLFLNSDKDHSYYFANSHWVAFAEYPRCMEQSEITNFSRQLLNSMGGDCYTVFTANAFQYPASGTDWTPQLEGAHLAASLGAKKCWIPLKFLKQGDEIISYKLLGDAVETNTLTLDCKLVRVNLADPLTTTNVAGGAITQVAIDGDFDAEATLTNPEVVATDKQYVLEILGTTGAGDTITVIGAEVKVNRIET